MTVNQTIRQTRKVIAHFRQSVVQNWGQASLATTEVVPSPPQENEHWSQQWRQNTFHAGQKTSADWKNVLQTYKEGRKSRK